MEISTCRSTKAYFTRFSLLLLFVLSNVAAGAQSANWTFVKGYGNLPQYPTYGIQGTAAAANTPGGRENSASWQIGDKFYLFGGTGHTETGLGSPLNDLWEYDTTTGNWRWIKGSRSEFQTGTYGTQGIAAAANTPGGRENSASWQIGGKLYLFGGEGYAASGISTGYLNDLWEFDTATGNWRWLKGSSSDGQYGTYGTQGIPAVANTPSCRNSSVAWESGGKLYLFGGYGVSTAGLNFLNDLWEYDTATGNWRWIKGSTAFQAGTYGTQGIASVANTPGGRQRSLAWESGGKLYLFGGYKGGHYNDLWEYDTATGNWRWIKGSNITNQFGSYGTQGSAAAANTPGAREGSVSWESGGKVYLFGGTGYAASGGLGELNDLWEYETATGNWRWLKGSNFTTNQTGTYGTQGIAAAANIPGSRNGSVGWESGNKLYLFGGFGYAESGPGHLNDLWEYDTAMDNWRWVKGSSTENQTGTYGTQGIATAANKPGARSRSVSWESGGKLYLFGGYGYAASGKGQLNDLWEYDTTSGNWRWIKGSSSAGQSGTYGAKGIAAQANTPGSREQSVSWQSGDKLYFFGGEDNSGRIYNDLWEFDTATGNWRWLKGSSSVDQAGSYGTQGSASAANTPGAREGSVTWESGGKLYLFGGYGYSASGSGNLNDLWEYDTATGNWRWIKGSTSANPAGSYGTKGTAAATNTPGGRYGSVGWESGGKLYLFGGGINTSLNDLWEYDTATGNWRWLKGSSSTNQFAIYGTFSTAAAANTPGSRNSGVSWESGGKLYLFGGYGKATFDGGELNDLWEYDTATGNWRWINGSSSARQLGTYGTKGTAASGNSPGAREFSVGWQSGGKLYLFGGHGIGTNGDFDYRGDLWSATFVSTTATLNNLTVSSGTLSPTFASGTTSYTASVNNNTTSITVTPTLSDTTATVKVNGVVVASGRTSAPIALNEGPNTITTVITAQDGSTTKTYTITINRSYLPVITSFTPTTSITGATVTINGNYFSGATAISFGGVPATSFSVVSVNSITAVVGAGASGSVSVVTPSGTGALPGYTFVPKPTITAGGQTTFASGGSVTLTASPGTGFAYRWAKDGADIPGATSATYTANATGSYTVAIIANSVSQTSTAIAVASIFVLPANNFKLTANGETCKTSNNGSINVTAAQSKSYTAVLTGNSLNVSKSFISTVDFTDLQAGTYNVCISVAGETSYKQCFDVVITEPKDLSLYTVLQKGNKVALTLDGGSIYNIELNGSSFQTGSSNVTIDLQPGENTLRVMSDKPCQGVIEKYFELYDNPVVYPNPFESALTISNLPDTKTNIQVSSLDGRVVLEQLVTSETGSISLSLPNLNAGVYLLKATSADKVYIYKIIRK